MQTAQLRSGPPGLSASAAGRVRCPPPLPPLRGRLAAATAAVAAAELVVAKPVGPNYVTLEARRALFPPGGAVEQVAVPHHILRTSLHSSGWLKTRLPLSQPLIHAYTDNMALCVCVWLPMPRRRPLLR